MTQKPDHGELKRAAEARKAACERDARRASFGDEEYAEELASRMEDATVASVPLIPLLSILAENEALKAALLGYDAEELARDMYIAVNRGRGGAWKDLPEDTRQHWRSLGIAAARHLSRALQQGGGDD